MLRVGVIGDGDWWRITEKRSDWREISVNEICCCVRITETEDVSAEGWCNWAAEDCAEG